MPKINQKLRLRYQLPNGATGKFVQAVLLDADNVALAASPVNLSHIANGLYGDNSVGMPDTPLVTAQFTVYDDSGHTTPSEDFLIGINTFELSDPPVVTNVGLSIVGKVGAN